MTEMKKHTKAILILENGMAFDGYGFGAIEETIGELVFVTEIAGYQEMLTDSTYSGKIICFASPSIGNYGANLEDIQSDSVKANGIVVKSFCEYPNNWRCEMELEGYLKQNNIMGIAGIDTRALTGVLRTYGEMKAIISCDNSVIDMFLSNKQQKESGEDYAASQYADKKTMFIKSVDINGKFNRFSTKDSVKKLSSKNVIKVEGDGRHVVVIDLGIKMSIIEYYKTAGYRLTIVPYNLSAEEIISFKPDGILLSNGPGSPFDLNETIETIKKLSGQKPIFGIGLGHELLSIALNGEKSCRKLQCGFHGSNYPIKDLNKNKIYISNLANSYIVTDANNGEVTHIGVNNSYIYGIKYRNENAFSVQFHPDTLRSVTSNTYIFDEFDSMMGVE